jgi:hypothetical protein
MPDSLTNDKVWAAIKLAVAYGTDDEHYRNLVWEAAGGIHADPRDADHLHDTICEAVTAARVNLAGPTMIADSHTIARAAHIQVTATSPLL